MEGRAVMKSEEEHGGDGEASGASELLGDVRQ